MTKIQLIGTLVAFVAMCVISFITWKAGWDETFDWKSISYYTVGVFVGAWGKT